MAGVAGRTVETRENLEWETNRVARQGISEHNYHMIICTSTKFIGYHRLPVAPNQCPPNISVAANDSDLSFITPLYKALQATHNGK
jgi:hypothetical protein